MSLSNEISTILNGFVVHDGDFAKRAPELLCLTCDDSLCDIEHGDSLATLVSVALEHFNRHHSYKAR